MFLLVSLVFWLMITWDHYVGDENFVLRSIAKLNYRSFARNHYFETIFDRILKITAESQILLDDLLSGDRHARLQQRRRERRERRRQEIREQMEIQNAIRAVQEMEDRERRIAE